MRSLILALSNAVLFPALSLLIYPLAFITPTVAQVRPVAVDDHYSMLVDCNNNVLAGNLLDNDNCGGSGSIVIAHVIAPETGLFSCGPNGNFVYIAQDHFHGIVEFRYRVQNAADKNLYADARVTITVRQDSDCDKICDENDIDCDNDGILDIHEGFGKTDTDNDGIPDCFDIDSDNDGITDLDEWQKENFTILPSLVDINNDGWDDAFDPEYGGEYYPAVDTDEDGIPDYLDLDSDNDSKTDFEEASGCKSGCQLSMNDADSDGLDDVFDEIECCSFQTLTLRSKLVLSDSNSNNVRDWRDAHNAVTPDLEQEAEIIDYEPLVYPNPVTESCSVVLENLELNDTEAVLIRLFSENGELILQERKYETSFQLHLNNITQGSYIFIAETASRSYRTLILKH